MTQNTVIYKHVTLLEGKAWSILSPTPHMYYHRTSDTYLVWWNGIITTHRVAMLIAATTYFDVFPSITMKQAAFDEVKRARWSGVFDGLFNIHTITAASYYAYISKKVNCNTGSPIPKNVVLSWFDKRNVLCEIKEST